MVYEVKVESRHVVDDLSATNSTRSRQIMRTAIWQRRTFVNKGVGTGLVELVLTAR